MCTHAIVFSELPLFPSKAFDECSCCVHMMSVCTMQLRERERGGGEKQRDTETKRQSDRDKNRGREGEGME